MSYQLYDDIGITEKEELYNRVSHERMLSYMRRYPIVDNHRSHNSYGEFRFITVIVPRKRNDGSRYNDALTFYGNGYHEYREVSPDYWCFNVGNGCLYTGKPALNKRAAIKAVQDERAGMTFDTRPANNTFTFLADLTDDDAAIVELYG